MRPGIFKIAAFLLIWMPLCKQSAHSLTLSNIRVMVRQNIGDRPDPKFKYSNGMITRFVNEAQRTIVNETWCLETLIASGNLAAGTTLYSLTTPAIRVSAVVINNTPLLELSTFQLDADSPTWRSQNGTPSAYYYDLNRKNMIGLYPVPTAVVTYAIYGYIQDTALISSSDTPFLSYSELTAYHDLIVYLASYRILANRGSPDAAIYKKLYDDGIAVMKTNLPRKVNKPVDAPKLVTP